MPPLKKQTRNPQLMNTCFTFKPEYSCRTTGSYKDRHKLKCSIKAYINAQRLPLRWGRIRHAGSYFSHLDLACRLFFQPFEHFFFFNTPHLHFSISLPIFATSSHSSLLDVLACWERCWKAGNSSKDPASLKSIKSMLWPGSADGGLQQWQIQTGPVSWPGTAVPVPPGHLTAHTSLCPGQPDPAHIAT